MKIFSIIGASISTAFATTHADLKHVVAMTIYLEARGEGELGMRAVASVIQNRADNKRCSFSEICLERRQFSCWNDGFHEIKVPAFGADKKAWEFCLSIESDMKNGVFYPIGPWTHYYAISMKNPPKWSRGKKKTQIGNHLFLTL